jgi:GntR family transcriptional regulator/MocR family aminotransferase
LFEPTGVFSNRQSTLQALTYGSTFGNQKLREVLVEYLNETRALHCSVDNVLITRGSQMGIHLAAKLLLQEHDSVIVGTTNYISADVTFLERKANLVRVSVDKDGLNVNEIETLCKQQKIKAVYVTSHHHHPTTVTLSAERRIRFKLSKGISVCHY